MLETTPLKEGMRKDDKNFGKNSLDKRQQDI